MVIGLQRGALVAVAAARELGVVAVAALVYFGVRGLSEGSVDEALANADTLMRLERAAGIAWEATLQRAIVDHHWLVTLANSVYVYGHWPVIAACAAWLYARRRDRYVVLRNAMFLSGLVGFAFFAFVPVAPPRLAAPGTVDTVALYSEAYRTLQPPSLTNVYAALPSLHVGWNLLVGIVVFGTARRRAIRALAALMPVAMILAVVVTANHYVVDAALGAAIVLASLSVARRLEGRRAVRGRGRRVALPTYFAAADFRGRADAGSGRIVRSLRHGVRRPPRLPVRARGGPRDRAHRLRGARLLRRTRTVRGIRRAGVRERR